MSHHGKHVADRHDGEHDETGESQPSEYQHSANHPDNPVAEHEDRSAFTHDGQDGGGGTGRTHDGGVVGGAGVEGDQGGTLRPDEPNA